MYSARKEALIKPLLDQFTAKTGIKVNLVTGKADALISRLVTEGKYSPADILITTDVGRLVRAKQQGLTQPIASNALQMAMPANLRDPEQHWYALTTRARPIMYAPDRVKPSELSDYEELADARWKGRICIRSSNNVYNQSLVAAMLSQVGERQTSEWLSGFVKNFARPPKGGDRDQIKAVAAGQCDIAIANTYYLGGMLNADEANKAAASKVKVFWPNQQGRGSHVNISGAVLSKHAPHKKNAIALLEFMLTPQAQQWYAAANHEYPVLTGVEASETLQSFGEFTGENIPLQQVGERNAEAVMLMDKAGWR